MAYMSSEVSDRYEFHFGGHAGIYFPIWVRPQLELQPELLFSMQGGGFKFPNTTTTYRMNYLLVPLSAKWFFGEYINIQAGPQLGFLLNANKSFNGTDVGNVRDDLKPYDFSALFGLGFDGRTGLDLSLRYVLGLTALLREDHVTFPKNRVVQISMGYRFRQIRGRRR